jgi:hypothetical protein
LTTSIEQIEEYYRQRKAARGPVLGRWHEVAKQYDGAVVVPLPEVDEVEKASVVNLLGPGLDQLAMRIASTMPDISCPPLRPGIDRSENLARLRREAMLSWWDMNRMDVILRQRARYLLGYGCAPVSISFLAMNPLDKRDIPHWRVLDPMCAFPAPTLDRNDIEPSDCIYAYQQSLRWLRQKYSVQANVLRKSKSATDETMFTILEYNDADETVLVALGAEPEPVRDVYGPWQPPTLHGSGSNSQTGTQSVVQLIRVPNRAGVPLTVVPGRITLSQLQGMFDKLMPMYQRAAKLDALELLAIEQSVFQDEWIVSHPGSPGEAVVVTEANGLAGIRGRIRNGTIIPINKAPGPATTQAIDRLERAERLVASLPAELGGESATNIRTARRGEMVLGAAIDMPVQEHQELFEDSMEAENRRAIAVMKAYYGSKPTSFYIPMNGKTERTDYTPNDTFETDLHYVKYSLTGTDANSFVIAGLQRVQAETMSPETFMGMDPFIEDVKEEMSRIYASGARRAMMASVENQASQGTIDPTFIARFIQGLHDGKTQPEDALLDAHRAMQEEQAAQQAQAQQTPGQPPGPQGQPGMAGPQGAIPNPPMQQAALSQILGNLRKPAAQSGPEQAMNAPPQNAMAQ